MMENATEYYDLSYPGLFLQAERESGRKVVRESMCVCVRERGAYTTGRVSLCER